MIHSALVLFYFYLIISIIRNIMNENYMNEMKIEKEIKRSKEFDLNSEDKTLKEILKKIYGL